LTVSENKDGLVRISVPDICSFTSLSSGYPPRPTGPDGSRLTELQPETTGKAFSEILFLQERLDMPCGIVWLVACRNGRNRFAARNEVGGFFCNSV
jgi:hypothetical protein